MKIKELSLSERPRERLLSLGPGALSNTELIALLLRSGTRSESALELAARLYHDWGGSLAQMSAASASSLCRTSGIKDSKAASLAAAFELGRRFFSEKQPQRPSLVSPELVYLEMRPYLTGLDHEECWLLSLDARMRLKSRRRLFSGTGDSVTFDARTTVRRALEEGASSLVLVHNHPSGDPHPSPADIKETEALHKAASACDISLIDHLIMGDRCFYSFSEEKITATD